MSRDVRRMLRLATSGEIPVVERLALAAGIFWRCLASSCATLNDDSANFCTACGRSRKP